MGLQWQRYVYSNCLLISGTLVTDPLTVWSACLIDLNDLSDLTDSVTHPNNHLPIITHIFTHSLLDRWDLLIWNAQSVGNWLSLPPLCAWRELNISFFLHVTHFLNFWSITQTLQIYPVMEPESAEWCLLQWEDPVECWNIRVWQHTGPHVNCYWHSYWHQYTGKHSFVQIMIYKRLKWLILIYLMHRHQINLNVPKNTVSWEIYLKKLIELITCWFRYFNDISMLAQGGIHWDWVSQTIVMLSWGDVVLSVSPPITSQPHVVPEVRQLWGLILTTYNCTRLAHLSQTWPACHRTQVNHLKLLKSYFTKCSSAQMNKIITTLGSWTRL